MQIRMKLMLARQGLVAMFLFASLAAPSAQLPGLDEAVSSKRDLWGEAAMRQPNGPSYDFFADLLPPLRYVNAAFHHYPIVLSAPGSLLKARLISNGSAINARANLKTWKEVGVPVMFRVGEAHQLYGEDLSRLHGPRYERGYLPVVQLAYEADGATYEEESFASVEPQLAEHGVVFTKFTLTSKKPGIVSAQIDSKAPLSVSHNAVRDTNGHALVWFSGDWKWNAAEKTLFAHLSRNQSATLAIAIKPMAPPAVNPLLPTTYKPQHERCAKQWQALLDRGMQIEVPEPIVNDAWRSLVIGNFMLLEGNAMNYSAGNAYERLYQAECGDSARVLALFGHTSEVGKMIPSLFNYTRDGLKFHNAGFKLQTLSHYYWLTRDTNYVNSIRPMWQQEVKRIVEGREKESGLFPREQYCGDIFTKVYSLHSNGACWRGLHDFAAVLADIGERTEAQRLAEVAKDFRQAIIAATEKSEYKDAKPTFIPVALFGEEKPYETLTASMLGSYWDLIAPYMLGSGMFGPGSARERAIIDYLQEHGGICMGMIRFHQHSGLFANEDALDDNYGLRYTSKLLQLDEVDRALVSFYGKLAQGLTRDTFIGAEGTGLRPLDDHGRPMYLPPNSTGNALSLWTLRDLLVQDWDMDDDGQPETLRLLFATPKRWLEDGKKIKVEHAPTAFGPVSMWVESKLHHGEVIAKVELPTRNLPKETLLRIRVPEGWQVISAEAKGKVLKVDSQGTVNISAPQGKATIHFHVKPI
ncbi:MAG: hypothetical protein QOJ40_837 [Verrucomicrobiota bacterium]